MREDILKVSISEESDLMNSQSLGFDINTLESIYCYIKNQGNSHQVDSENILEAFESSNSSEVKIQHSQYQLSDKLEELILQMKSGQLDDTNHLD